VDEAIADTGPLLHLHEIGRLDTLVLFQTLILPNLVQHELHLRGIEPDVLAPFARLRLGDSPLSRLEILQEKLARLQPADLEVLAWARAKDWQGVVLTDDLALRRILEDFGATVIGSLGILVRAYARGVLARQDLDSAVEALLQESSLHASKAFKVVARTLVRDLP